MLYSQSSIVYSAGTNIDVGTGADVCAGTITVNGTFSGNGTFCTNPLPVELVSFNATLEGNNVELTWKTETEVNNFGFEIERGQSLNVKSQTTWEKIGFVEGSGNSNSPKEYSFIDRKLHGGSKFQYRLKQLDNDGQFEYSDIIELEIVPNKYDLLQNYPNPFNPGTVISWQLPVSSHVSLKVYDILGNEVAILVDENKEAGYYETKFSAIGGSASGGDGSALLASGMYIYRLTAGNPANGTGYISTKKMLMIK